MQGCVFSQTNEHINQTSRIQKEQKLKAMYSTKQNYMYISTKHKKIRISDGWGHYVPIGSINLRRLGMERGKNNQDD